MVTYGVLQATTVARIENCENRMYCVVANNINGSFRKQQPTIEKLFNLGYLYMLLSVII